MDFKFKEKYETATDWATEAINRTIDIAIDASDWATEAINRTIDIAIDASLSTYDFSKNMGSEDGRKKNWEDIKKKFNDLAKVVMREAKDVWKEMADNWEAAVILTCASLGLTHIIGELPAFIKLPAFFESQMVVPVIAVIIITALVMLIEHKMKGATNETAGERTG